MAILNNDRNRQSQKTRDTKEESVRGRVKGRTQNKERRYLKSK